MTDQTPPVQSQSKQPTSYFQNFCRDCWLTLPLRTRPDGDPTGACECGRSAVLRAECWAKLGEGRA